MNSRNSSDSRAAWKSELRRTSECLPIERLSEEILPHEHSHLAHCARCEAEFALWLEMNADAQSGAEVSAVEAVVDQLRHRSAAPVSNVVPMPRRWISARWSPAALAAAAVVVVAVSIGVLVQQREPSVEGPASVARTYRSASVEVVAPTGDLASAPTALQWKPVASADGYDVQVMEVDRTVLWRASNGSTRVPLPAELVAQFVPGKTLLWQVRARRGQAIVADSGIQRFRVSATR